MHMPNYRNNSGQYNTYRNMPVQTAERTPRRDGIESMPLAMAYVPWQKWQNIYEAEKGFCNGTIFQDLNLPFYGTGGVLR